MKIDINAAPNLGSGAQDAPFQAADFNTAGAALQMGAQVAGDLGTKMQEARIRVAKRDEVVNRVLLKNQYRETLEQEYARRQTEENMASPEQVSDFQRFAQDQMQETFGNYNASPEAQAKLMEDLDNYRFSYTNKFGAESIAAQREVINSTIGREVSSIARETPATMEGIAASVIAVKEAVSSVSDGMSSKKESAHVRAGVAEVMSRVIEKTITQGNFDTAQQFMASPFAAQYLEGKDIDGFTVKINQAVKERDKYINEFNAKLQVARALNRGKPVPPGMKMSIGHSVMGTSAPQEKTDAFDRNLQKVLEMEATMDPKDLASSSEYKWRTQKLEKDSVAGKGGLAMTFDPETGRVTSIAQNGQQSGMLGSLSSTRALNESEKIDRLKATIDVVKNVIKSAKDDPTRVGMIGSLRSIAQTVTGIAATAAPDFITGPISEFAAEAGIPGYFDPSLPENEIYENMIALELAKMRVTAGGGGIRAVGEAFKKALKDVKITGGFGPEDVVKRYQTVLSEFQREREDAIQRLSGIQDATPAPPPGFVID